jgi:hypothetical protein
MKKIKNKFIVTTTIYNPSKALLKYAEMRDWQLIVVGDTKTPHEKYKNIKNILYVTPEDQEKMDIKLSNLIGWRCIQRRNFGYILAYKLGADIVATIDDDNIPLNNWGKNIYLNKKDSYNKFITDLIAFDPLSIFKFKEKIWHRGFPVQLINRKDKLKKTKGKIIPHVQANLWNVNPDIDAFNRACLKKENFTFDLKKPYFSNKLSPFNSQNTILAREILKHYFLFPHVGRMDDIWASYYVQAKGFKVLYCEATVKQDRNLHDLVKDFNDEIIGYNNNLNLINSIKKNPNSIKNFLPKRSYNAFKQYQKNFI